MKHNKNIDYDEDGDLEELLMQVVNLSVAERGIHSAENDTKNIAENGLFSLPSTSGAEQVKIKKQRAKKKKVKNSAPATKNVRTKENADVVNEMLELLEGFSSSHVNGSVPSVLDIVGAYTESAEKPKHKKRTKKKSTLTSEIKRLSETVPKKSSNKSRTVTSAKKKQEE